MIEGQEPEVVSTPSFTAAVGLENSAALSEPGASVSATDNVGFSGFSAA